MRDWPRSSRRAHQMIVLAVLGLVLPGFALARALRLPAAWAAAFPLSALLLADTVIAIAMAGAPLRFGPVLAAITVVTALALLAARKRPPEADPPARRPIDHGGSRSLRGAACVLAAIIVLGLALLTSLYPLTGPDTVFRWDALA